MRIFHNIPALISYNQLYKNNVQTSKAMEKLSSGLRIQAAADAAGLSISQKMKGQIRGLSQADRNVLDGISMVQVADGGLNGIQNMLQRIRELTVQAANDSLTDEDREQIQNEIAQLTDNINETATNTTFNTIHLLNGTNSRTAGTGSTGSSFNYENVLSTPPVDVDGHFLFRTNHFLAKRCAL